MKVVSTRKERVLIGEYLLDRLGQKCVVSRVYTRMLQMDPSKVYSNQEWCFSNNKNTVILHSLCQMIPFVAANVHIEQERKNFDVNEQTFESSIVTFKVS